MGKNEELCEYGVRCHLVVDAPRGGHIWPDTDENRKLGRLTRVEMSEKQAARYGADLIQIRRARSIEAPQNKQVTETQTK